MIKAIIFDCFGVLSSGTWQTFWQSLPTAEQQKRAGELNRAFDAGHIDKQTFLEELQKLTSIPSPIIEKEVIEDQTEKNRELLDYIRTLRGTYKLSILSNISSNWIKDTFLTEEEQALFDDILASHEVGVTKPDPRVFKLACGRLGVEPNEAVLVDDIERYCTAAAELGMKTVVYKNFQQCKRELGTLLKA